MYSLALRLILMGVTSALAGAGLFSAGYSVSAAEASTSTHGDCSGIFADEARGNVACTWITMPDGSACEIYRSPAEEEGVVVLKRFSCLPNTGSPVAVKFFWLDSFQTSYLLLGYADGGIDAVLGRRPHVAQNAVYHRLAEIYEQFGSRLDPENYWQTLRRTYMRVKGISNQADVELSLNVFTTNLEDADLSVKRRMRLPLFDRPIIWPMLEQASTIINGAWPSDFAYSYSNVSDDMGDAEFGRIFRQSVRAGDRSKLGEELSSCLRFSRLVSRAEFANYWTNVERATDALLAERIDLQSLAGELPLGDHSRLPLVLASNESYDFLASVSSEGWPEDFLLVSGRLVKGSPEGCEVAVRGGIQFEALPRTLRSFVAVVEPVAGSQEVRGVTLDADQRTKLRGDAMFDSSIDWRGIRTLSAADGDTYVIPLQISLDYDLDVLSLAGLRDRSVGEAIMEASESFPDADWVLDLCDEADNMGESSCHAGLSGAVGALPAPGRLEVTPSYLLGEAYRLAAVNVGGQTVDVQGQPQATLFAAASEEPKGSCPFIYWRLADGTAQYGGRILVGATGVDQAMIETLQPPAGATGLWIREIEPEVTVLTEVSVATDGESAISLLPDTILIRPQQGILIDLPVGATSVTIAGYYEPVS